MKKMMIGFAGLYMACAQIPIQTGLYPTNPASLRVETIPKFVQIKEYEDFNTGKRIIPKETLSRISLTDRVGAFLTYDYSDRKIEIPYCVVGQKNGNEYYVNDLVFPHILKSTDTSSVLLRCKVKNYLGLLHNHSQKPRTDGKCVISGDDLRRFINDDNAKLEIIVCSVFIGKDPAESNILRIKTIFKDMIPKDTIEKYKKEKVILSIKS